MTFTLYNTLTRRAEPFVPADPARVTFYSCGPTVYDHAHIGNFRAFLVADLARRWIESPLCELRTGDGGVHRGPREVVHVMNITDVGHMTDDAALDGSGEDKMDAAARRLREAKKSGKLPPDAESVDPSDPKQIADFYARAFLEDARTLGLRVASDADADPRRLPRATEHVRTMLELVVDLIRKGHAYRAGPAVYFRTSTFPDYGALSGNTLEKLRTGAGGRVDERNQAQKEHPADFLLWKADPSHLMKWDPDELLGRETGLGAGYPGWHIECSAMSLEAFRDILGQPDLATIDLHSGGEDNIFPHHECEIAQSRCHTGAGTFSRAWLHTRHLMVEGEKMSKSKGNFFTIGDLLARGFEPAAIRLELLKTHYRSNANFTEQGLKDSQRMVRRLRDFAERAESSENAGESDDEARDAFAAAMQSDLNIAGALGALSAWMNRTPEPARADAELLRTLDRTLGLLELGVPEADAGEDDAAILALIAKREDARRSKDWAESDRLRDHLAEMGVEVKDGPEGATWRRVAKL